MPTTNGDKMYVVAANVNIAVINKHLKHDLCLRLAKRRVTLLVG